MRKQYVSSSERVSAVLWAQLGIKTSIKNSNGRTYCDYLTQHGQTPLCCWHFCWYWRLKMDALVRLLRRWQDLRRWVLLFCRVGCRANHVRLKEPWHRPAGSHSRAGFLFDSPCTGRAETTHMQKRRGRAPRRRAPVMDWGSKRCCF